MKSTTVKLSITIFALTIIIFLISSFKTSEAGNKYLTIRTNELMGRIIVVHEDGKIDEIDLEKLSNANLSAIALKINQTINSVANNGYELVSSTGGENISTYTFIKK